MKNNSSILVDRLILVGRRKNYIVPFTPGVNIIYGDSSTGKSSIIELINYLLGASKFIYDEEIESSVLYALLEVRLNDTFYVIKRDIFDFSKWIEVYQSSFEEMPSVFAKKYAPKFSDDSAPDGYFSDFIMTALNFPLLRVRQAPTQAESKMVRLSFRDLFKYCYLNQDDVGSKQILNLGNWSRYTKNKQTFKYIFNLLDTNISDLEQEISELTSEQSKMRQKYKSVSDFLRETEFDSAINLSDSHEELERQADVLHEQLLLIKQKMIADSEKYTFLKDTLSIISTKVLKAEDGRKNSELAIERYSRLKNDYRADVDKLKAINHAKAAIGTPVAKKFPCPVCDTELTLDTLKDEYEITDSDKVGHEINTLNRRMKDLALLIEQEKGKFQRFTSELRIFMEDQLRARRMLDEEAGEMITPYLSERDGIATELATVREKSHQLHHSLKVRNQQQLIFKEIESLSTKIDVLDKRLQQRRESAPSLSQVASDLGDLLNQYLKKVNIKDRRDVAISESTYLPVIRNRDYVDITSGGLRTILSIGHFVGLLKYSLDNDVNYPRFLMIDTVGKYLGKTQKKYMETNLKDDEKEGVSDPSKYNNIYQHLIGVAEIAESKNVSCQIILVDNDVPQNIQEEYAGFVVARYSSNGFDGLPIGLIDDAKQA